MNREYSLIDDLLREFGLAALIKEGQYSHYSGPLDEVTPNCILSASFDFEMWNRIQDPLTFKLNCAIQHQYIQLSRAVTELSCRVIPWSHVDNRGLEINEIGVELRKTYLLLFGRNDSSLRIGQTLSVRISFLRACRYHIFPTNVPVQLEDFPFFQHRLHLIQLKMDE